MLAPKFMYGSLRFDDFREVDGVQIPFKQTAQLMDPKDDLADFIPQFTISEFAWDKFEGSEIRLLVGLETMGEEKYGRVVRIAYIRVVTNTFFRVTY